MFREICGDKMSCTNEISFEIFDEDEVEHLKFELIRFYDSGNYLINIVSTYPQVAIEDGKKFPATFSLGFILDEDNKKCMIEGMQRMLNFLREYK
jgi:hypothetical protein